MISATDPRRSLVAAAALALACILYAVGLGMLSNQPPGSHPDEYGKAEQIINDDRNYNHPQLLMFNLEIASLTTTSNTTRLVKVGRKLSNVYAAITLMLLTLIGWRLFGVRGAICFFLLFALNTALLVSGRYLKEDIFLLFAIALLALTFTETSPTRADIAAGLGCAAVISAKYVGVVFAATFLIAYLHHRSWDWRPSLKRMLPVFAIATAIINYRVLLHPIAFWEGFHNEVGHATSNHDGIAMSSVATIYAELIVANIPLLVLGCIPILAVFAWRRRYQPEIGLLLFACLSAFVYAVAIQLAPVKIPRYGFPLLLVIPLILVIATGHLVQKLPTVAARLLVLVPVAFYAATESSNAVTVINNARNDTRTALFDDVMANPAMANTRVLADAYSGLSLRLRLEGDGGTNPNGIKLTVAPFAVDQCRPGHCGEFDYVVTACTTFMRFFRSAAILDATNERRRAGYAALLKSHAVVRSFSAAYEDNEGRYGMYESPCIRVIDTRRLTAPAPVAVGRHADQQATNNAVP